LVDEIASKRLQEVPQIESMLELVIFMDVVTIFLETGIVELVVEVNQAVESILV
jgi:hypothetical protein